MKKLLSVFLSLMLVITVIPIGIYSVSAEPSGEFTYTVSDGNATITEYIGEDSVVTIPSTLDSYPVTCIGEYTFSWCTDMTGVTIPDSVTQISDYAFSNCSGLSLITIPGSVTTIGYKVFNGCTLLSQINVDANDPNYASSDGVLFDKSMKTLIQYPAAKSASEYTVPSSVTSISGGQWGGPYGGDISSVFEDCINLTKISIPSSVINIDEGTFSRCSFLSQINVDEGNLTYKSLNGVLFDKAMQVLIKYPSGNTASEYTVPNGVQTIDGGAFEDSINLTSVILPDGVTDIGDYPICDWGFGVFKDCINLTSIIMPDSVKNICSYAFGGCSSLTEVIIPNGVTSINYALFNNCTSLTSITIPDSVNYIIDYAFLSCTSLETVTFPSSVKYIGNNAFSDCTKLSRAIFEGDIPDAFFGTNVFLDCSDTFKIYYMQGTTGWTNPWNDYTTEEFDPSTLHTVTYNTNGAAGGSVPVDSKTYVYNSAVTVMGNTGNMEKSTYEFKGWNTKEDGTGINYAANDTFNMGPEDVVLYANWYRNETPGDPQQWKNAGVTWDYTPLGTSFCMVNGCSIFTGSLIIPDSIDGRAVIGIGYGMFYYSDLTSVSIPDSVSSIGDYAFFNSGKLTNITIPSSVTSIGESAFCDCAKLTQINVDSNNLSYSSRDGVLFDITKTELIQYPGGKAGSYTVPDGVQTIDSYAFEGCSEITGITIPDNVNNMGYCVFNFCTKLTQINVNDNNTTFISEDGVLFDEAKTTLIQFPGGKTGSYTIPGSVTSISTFAFYDCVELTSVTISGNVSNIGEGTFSDCIKLTQINVDDTNTSYSSEDGILFDITKANLLQFPGGKTGSYIIPNGVTNIGYFAFEGCDKLTDVTISNSITGINPYAFYGFTGLKNITIPDSVLSIGYCAFCGCTGLTGINIPNSVTNIDSQAFYGCTGLSVITIPDRITSIEYYTFCGCTGLIRVTIPESVTSIDDDAFFNCDKLTVIRGKEGSYASEYATSKGIAFLKVDDKSGDVNYDGVITAGDALMVLQASVNKIVLDNGAAVLANVDGNDTVSAGDALLILQYAVKKINKFPAVW